MLCAGRVPPSGFFVFLYRIRHLQSASSSRHHSPRRDLNGARLLVSSLTVRWHCCSRHPRPQSGPRSIEARERFRALVTCRLPMWAARAPYLDRPLWHRAGTALPFAVNPWYLRFGTFDRLLPLFSSAAGYRGRFAPSTRWIGFGGRRRSALFGPELRLLLLCC